MLELDFPIVASSSMSNTVISTPWKISYDEFLGRLYPANSKEVAERVGYYPTVFVTLLYFLQYAKNRVDTGDFFILYYFN